MRLRSILVILATAAVLYTQVSIGSPARETSAKPGADAIESHRAMIYAVGAVLRDSGKVARINYEGVCGLNHESAIEWSLIPQLKLHAPIRTNSGIVAIREIFQDEARVKVSEDPKGIIHIVVDDPAVAILATRFPVLEFTPDEQFTDQLALNSMMNDPVLRAEEKRLGTRKLLEGGLTIIGGLNQVKGNPQLPARMTDVSFDQVLDYVAVNFKQIVLFGTCTEPASFTVDSVILTSCREGLKNGVCTDRWDK